MKIKANASKRKAMSSERMKKREAELQAEVDPWLVAAEAPTPRSTSCTGLGAATSCPSGLPTRRSGLPRSAPRRPILSIMGIVLFQVVVAIERICYPWSPGIDRPAL